MSPPDPHAPDHVHEAPPADRVPFGSSRGGAPNVSFRRALLDGLAPDGGLYVPRRIPQVEPAAWREAPTLPELAARVLEPWIGAELGHAAVRRTTADAFDFPAPVVALQGDGWDGVHVLELFHGPTLSFKDFGARAMARWMGVFLRDRDEPLTILVATSGDTGSAVADGFAGQHGVRVVLLFPEGQVSAVQRRQLVARRPGVTALAVDGTFDDCQRMVKAAFADPALDGVALSSANSINVGRLLPQMLYYLWAAGQGGFEEVAFCVPSGNLGNLTGGVLAALSGLPVRRFVAAHNANDYFPRFLMGRADAPAGSVRTLSNAMDVGVPSNLERLQVLLTRERLGRTVWPATVTDRDTLAAIRRVHEATGYVADPHTAVGLEAARRYRAETGDGAPLVVLATAHPAKFPETVEQALGRRPETPERLARLWDEPEAVRPLAPTSEALRDVIRKG